MIAENILSVENIIKEKSNKDDIKDCKCKLIAVSKTKPVSALKEAYDYGIRDFGENKVQELTEKIPEMPNDIRWHLIGHLQRNKVKYIVDKVYLIHSVDSLRLANQIDVEAKKKNVNVNILIEVNVAKEESKFGLMTDEVKDLVLEISKLENVHIKGLMTIAPYDENPENNRVYFRKLKELASEIDSMNIPEVEMTELSMGMTNDYPIAIEEGSTYVRVGTGIFGERNYNI